MMTLLVPPSTPVKLTTPPEPALRRLALAAKVSVEPAAPGLVAIVELPARRVSAPKLSARGVPELPLPRRVPPLRLTAAAAPRRTLLLAAVLSSTTVPPFCTVRPGELAMAPAAP